ncbi:hypothetical protein POX_c04205 [Penicillium oxalicum]|uniref:Uncharacterized protein n=1 Tax=Penicillium oxalicum (strain 114-2 / CGMCC 5302) TaxID=933388 RepID=S7ZAZ8_PENO1|nr:hypothetical protein POX_c04205 [Penicillium oxalicum]EPS25836.1 hypothetical protein PDE_00772 [Penicillium oxalicum 114-2]KAI2791348.1 hypothetical protein POX_c04205 [Penicillium oxalicum]
MAQLRIIRSRSKQAPSITSEDPWRNDNPFGPPTMTRSFSSHTIRRLREALAKWSPASLAEKELLRKKNQYKIPLTHRNVDNFVTEQLCNEAIRPNQRTPEIQVVEWLQHVA